MAKEKIIKLITITAVTFPLIFYQLTEEITAPLIMAVVSMILFIWPQKKFFFIPLPISLIFFLLIFISFFSSLFSPHRYQSFLETIKLVSSFFLFLLAANLGKDNKFQKSLLLTIIAVASIWALTGIAEVTSRVRAEKILGLFVPFSWPESAASLFLLTLPATLSLYAEEKSDGIKKVIFFGALYFLTAAWLLSRSLVIPFFALSLILLFTLRSFSLFSPDLKRRLMLLTALLIITLFNFFPSFGSRHIPMQIADYQEKIFFAEKNDIWRFSVNSIKKNFWTGIGPGMFGIVYRQNLVKPWTWSDFAENELLQAFVEMGIFGFTAELFLFVTILFILLKTCRQAFRKKDIWKLAIALPPLAFLILSMFNFSFRIFSLQVLFFLLVSFVFTGDSHPIALGKRSLAFLSLPLIFSSLLIFRDGVMMEKGRKAFIAGDYDRSRGVLLDLTRRPVFLRNPMAYYWLSAIELERKNPLKAINYLEETKKLIPLNQEANFQIAKILYIQRHPDQAIKILEDSISRNPFLHPQYYLLLAVIYKDQGREELSQKQLRAIEKYFPTDNPNYEKGEYIARLAGYNPVSLQASYLNQSAFINSD